MKPGITSFRFLDEAERDEQDRMIRDALNELVQVSIVSVKAANPTKSQSHQFSVFVPAVTTLAASPANARSELSNGMK